MSEPSFNQQKQVVDSQYNAGRDQIIQNVIIVGQFLDFANIEGLIPKQSASPDFTTITSAIEKTFSGPLEGDLVNGLSFVGDTLRRTVMPFLPRKRNALPTVTISQILREIFRVVVDKVYEMNYQIHFSEKFTQSLYAPFAEFIPSLESYQKIMRLESLQLLWAKHFQQDQKECNFAILLQPPDQKYHVNMIRITGPSSYFVVDFSTLSIEQTRIVMIGLVTDLLRWSTMGTSYLKFMQSLVDLINADGQKEQPASSDSEKSA